MFDLRGLTRAQWRGLADWLGEPVEKLTTMEGREIFRRAILKLEQSPGVRGRLPLSPPSDGVRMVEKRETGD
jgi:hypothetical protein